MRTYNRHARWWVIMLILAVGLSGCYKSAGGSLEPTPSNSVGQVAAVNTDIPTPTAEEATELPSPIPPSPTERPTQEPTERGVEVPTNTVAAFPTAATAAGQGGANVTGGVTQTSVIALAPSFTPVPPTRTPTPTEPPTLTPTQFPTQPPTIGPTASFTPYVVAMVQPSPTYTLYAPPAAQPQEAIPPVEQPVNTPEGQGGMVAPTATQPVVAMQATLTENQMTATAIIFGATMTMAALQGTIIAPTQGVPVQPGVTQQPGVIVATPIPATPMGQCTTHLVAPGDTLSRIALTYNVTTQQIAQANNIVNPDLILAGATLIIPCPLPATPTPVGGVVATPLTPGTTTTGAPFNYIVEPGDNLYRISIRFNVSMAALMSANGMTPATINLIYAGQQLYIPAATVPVVPTLTPTLFQQVQPQVQPQTQPQTQPNQPIPTG